MFVARDARPLRRDHSPDATPVGQRVAASATAICPPPRAAASLLSAAPSTSSISAPRSAPHYPTPRGYALARDQGVPGRGHDVKASGQSTDGNLTVIEIALDGGPPRHTQTHEDESCTCSRVLDIECGGDRFQVEPVGFCVLATPCPPCVSFRRRSCHRLVGRDTRWARSILR
jgi:hypothetical protein